MSSAGSSTRTLTWRKWVAQSLQLKTGLERILMEHFDGIQRVFLEIAADQAEFLQHVMGDRNDMASNGVSLKKVEQLARAGPYQLDIGKSLEEFHRLAHHGHRVTAGVSDPPGKDRDVGGWRMLEGWCDMLDLIESQEGGKVEFDAPRGQPFHQLAAGGGAGVGNGNFDVNVVSPSGDLPRLPFHLLELVGENLEGDRPIRYHPQDFLGESAVIGHASFAH